VDFNFTDEQNALAKTVREFAADAVAPYRRDSDIRGQYRDGLLAEMAGEGLFALRIPRQHGGAELDAISAGIVLEELAAADLSSCFPVLNAALVGSVLAANGTGDQLAGWLPPIARGEALVALCLTEPGHGTDAANIQARARPDGQGWVITGTKTSIMLAGCATHGLIFARTGPGGAHGITAFYAPFDSPAVSRERLSDLGCRAGGRGTLAFDDLRLGPGDVVGQPGRGFVEVMRGFAVSRALIALMAISVGQAAISEAIAHARVREAFGQPLGRFQGVSFPLAEHASLLHAARLVCFEALWRADNGLDPRVPANMAKWWAPRAAVEAVHQALLTLGHRGWSEDGPIAQRLRDVIGLQLADGTAAATKITVARHLLGREYAP
jgi:cyclohexanecarboxyl-CoA dehydrogenase